MEYISDDYLAAAIAKLSSYLSISEAVAGATLLAMANGAPDILTIIMTSGEHSNDLALGVLFGANLFACSVILGAVILATGCKTVEGVGWFLMFSDGQK